MTDLCEPSPELRTRNHWAYLNTILCCWDAGEQQWLDQEGHLHTPKDIGDLGYRYIFPVPSAYDVARLVKAARELDYFAWSQVRVSSKEVAVNLESLIMALRATLTPFPEPMP